MYFRRAKLCHVTATVVPAVKQVTAQQFERQEHVQKRHQRPLIPLIILLPSTVRLKG